MGVVIDPPKATVYAHDGEPSGGTFHCRWERTLKEGETPEWFDVEATSVYDAAHLFAISCDGTNPRPPAKRVVLVRTPEGEKKIQVTVRAALAYETVGI